MARVSTTLENLEYLKQQENNILLTEKEKREIEKGYKDFLIGTLKEEFYYEFIENSDYKETFNYLVMNSEIIQNRVLETMQEESQTRIKKIFRFRDKNRDTWVEDYKLISEWDDFDFENDINDNYIKILKQVYQEYSLKFKINQEKLKNTLETDARNFFKLKGYDLSYNFMLDNEIRDSVISSLTENKTDYDYLDSIYVKTINKIANEFKHTRQANNKQKEGNIITRHPILTCSLGIAHGLYKGFKNACK